MRKTAIDLFCGAGGLSFGFAKAGYQIVAGIDKNTAALETFESNLNATAINADLSDVDPQVVLDENEIDPDEIDIVIGGPPCQGFSFAGPQDIEDDRNELLREFFEWVKYVQPTDFVIENVPGLLSLEGGDVMNWIIGRAEYLDYALNYGILDSTQLGIPQSRERLIIIGSRDSELSFADLSKG